MYHLPWMFVVKPNGRSYAKRPLVKRVCEYGTRLLKRGNFNWLTSSFLACNRIFRMLSSLSWNTVPKNLAFAVAMWESLRKLWRNTICSFLLHWENSSLSNISLMYWPERQVLLRRPMICCLESLNAFGAISNPKIMKVY